MNTFDHRPQSHHGLHSSPAESPRLLRPASQASIHLYPDLSSPHPATAYPQSYKGFTPANLALPVPQTSFLSNFPTTAPLYPIYDATNSHSMMRTVSHAHPMHSATEQTASSRYSSSPHSISHEAGLPTAAYPSFQFSDVPSSRHVNPAVFNPYPMSRSTSGASDSANDINTQLLTPHVDYHQLPLSGTEVELRKVSDSLGRNFADRYVFSHQDHLAPHPQPMSGMYANEAARGWGNDFALSSERGGKVHMSGFGETDYERERNAQILNNKKLLDDVGLGGGGDYMRSRQTSGTSRMRKPSAPSKRRLVDGPIRASPRIASLHRSVSYADLDGVAYPDGDDDEYSDEQEYDDEDDFRPMKRTKGHFIPRKMSYGKPVRKVELSLWGLLNVYSNIPHIFPLFYYSLNNDLTINAECVPLIGSIPSTTGPLDKAESLRNFFHRGRRVLAQLDAFTCRCDRKYEGPEERWQELDYHTRIAIRDVRRKIVERCENYKYTRRDILDKHVGRGKWVPIDQGLIEWKAGATEGDPAGDLAHVTLTLPTPPPNAIHTDMSPRVMGGRQIRPMPSRHRLVSNTPHTARIASVAMTEPAYAPLSAPSMGYGYSSSDPPMHEEDNAMVVPMPSTMSAHTSPGRETGIVSSAPLWEGSDFKIGDENDEDEKAGVFQGEGPILWHD